MTADDQTRGTLTRRPFLKALAGGAVAVAGIGAGLARLGPGADRTRELPALALSSHAGYGVTALDIPLDSRQLAPSGGGRWQSKQVPTSTHSMVALTWARSSRRPRIRIRSRTGGRWQEWRAVPMLHDGPDRDAEGGGDVDGTDLVWVGAADGVQVEVSGPRPESLSLVLLHPARLGGRSGLAARRTGTGKGNREARRRRAPRPELRRRRDWGAEPSWRPEEITYNRTIRQIHVHHTVNSNSYARRDVAGLIRGMYRYHTHNLGWSDIGYNFLVDRFGRTWVGRAGGARRPVRGAHTLGFNSTSSGVSVIGNFETTRPSDAVLDAIAAVAAWKLDKYGRRARGRIKVRSRGSDLYAEDQVVRLPIIDGHRDTNSTACPGRYLYEALPAVRRRAQAILDEYPRS